jgi:phosphoglycolate phosphatase (TIGR01487 family)
MLSECKQLPKERRMQENIEPPYRGFPDIVPYASMSNGLLDFWCVALASDYDGTLADDGRVSDHTIQSLQKFRQSGRKLLLVTGRILNELESVFSRFDLFDYIVAENGAVLYHPGTGGKNILAPPPDRALIEELTRRGVTPLEMGEAIVATRQPHETVALEVIKNLGLELRVIFNKGAVMILPTGVNKRTGLHAALENLGISEHNVVGVGDAENDHAFLKFCECSVAVANAHPAIGDTADFVTSSAYGDGVAELIELVLKDDLRSLKPQRHAIPVGRDKSQLISISAHGSRVLVSGASDIGKSTFVAGFLETLIERRYQACVVDPEGDYEGFPGAIYVGDKKHAPSTDEILRVLQKPDAQVIVSLVGMAAVERPAFFDTLLPRLLKLRRRAGRPHWILVDEAHRVLPPEGTSSSAELAGQLGNLVLITGHPERIAASALAAVDAVLAAGPDPDGVIRAFAAATKISGPASSRISLKEGQLLAWFPRTGELRCLDIRLTQAERRWHQ